MSSVRELTIPGGWTEREVAVARWTFRLVLPARPDAFVEQLEEVPADTLPLMRSDPFWAQLWQAAGPMAEAVAQADWPVPTRVLELGCGSGLVGLAALARGHEVTLSDYVPEAVALALENAQRNGFGSRTQAWVLDWNAPRAMTFPVLVASDVLYDRRNHEPFLKVVGAMLAEGGMCWVGDAGRSALPEFIERARRAGWKIELFDAAGRPVSDTPLAQFRRLSLSRV